MNAKEMAEEANREITKARQELAAKMLENGYSPDEWQIADNLEEFIEGVGQEGNSYLCYAVKKHKLGA